MLTKRRKKFWARLRLVLGFTVLMMFTGFFSGFFSYLALIRDLSKAVAMGLAIAISAPPIVFAVFLSGLLPIFRLLRAEKLLPEIALELGSLDPEIRQNTLRQLLQRKDAVPILLKVLDLPVDKNRFWEWNGEEAHLLAVEGLGRLRAKEAVPKLVEKLQRTRLRKMKEKIFWALGEIGDPQAIQVLVPFLGEKEAEKALRKLGQGDFIDAFHRVLDSRYVDAVEKLREWAYRREVAAAFIRVLNSPLVAELLRFRMLRMVEEGSSESDRDSKLLMIWQQTLKHTLNSIWALVQLRAIEALPLLERIGRRRLASIPKDEWQDDPIIAECFQAIKILKPFTTLPRAASFVPEDISTLPRPAPAPEAPSTANLPAIPESEPKDIA
ncbi:HEAT repeat domain-containing protein [Fervidibacter sacchari]